MSMDVHSLKVGYRDRRILLGIRVFALAFCFMLVFCARPPIVVLPEYQTLSVKNSRLGVVLLQENLWIEGPREKVDSLRKEDMADSFSLYFQSGFPEAFSRFSAFQSITILKDPGISMGTQERPLADQEFFPVPVPRSYPSRLKDSVDFLLILDKFQAILLSRQRTAPAMGAGGFLMGTGGSSEEMGWSTYFSLSDLKNGRLVGYGKTEGVVSVRFPFIHSAWNEIVENLCRNIVSGSPNLRKKTVPAKH